MTDAHVGAAARPRPVSRGRSIPALALVAAGAVVAEALLLAQNVDGVFRAGWGLAAVAAAILIWIWFTSAWAASAAARGYRRRTAAWPRFPRLVAAAFLILVIDVAVLLYLASWALYVRTGSFARLDAIRYALLDYRDMTWFYVSRSEPVSLAILAVLIGAVGVSVPFLLRKAGRAEASRPGRPRVNPFVVWLALIALALGLLARVQADRSEIRKPFRTEALKFRLNPWIAFASSWRESATQEPVEPVLDTRELTPLGARWSIPAGSDRPPIVFVKIESIRADVVHRRHQGVEITPNLNALARIGVELTRAYSVTTHTDYSDVSTFSSLYPLRTREHHYYRTTDPWPKTLVYDLLERAGYATALVAAENLAWGNMDRFLMTPGLDFFFDAERSGERGRIDPGDSGIAREVREGVLSAGVLEDGLTTDVALRWMSGPLAAKRPLFLGLDLQSPHFPYELPPRAARPFQPSTVDFDVSFVKYPAAKIDVLRNAYYNALHESDRQLGRVLAALREAGVLDRSIVVVYGDHGEAFLEGGHVTHAAKPIEVVVRVPCVISAPRYLEARKDDYPAELIDLPPTVLGLIGWPRHPNFQGIDLFAPDRPPVEQRTVFIHTENPLSHSDAVVLAGRWKYVSDRQAGSVRLYDLASDPGEERDLRAREPRLAADLGGLLEEWRRRQLAYYHFPAYFERYYPPQPPRPRPGDAR